jgi:parvulin-like peptidyl-prolyl isomerase
MLALGVLMAACATPVPNVPQATAAAPDAGDAASPSDAASADTPEPTATGEPQAAVVNGESISMASYEQQVALYEASMVAAGQDLSTSEGKEAMSQGRQWVLNLMIEQTLIEQAAAREGILVGDDEVDATIASLREEIGEEDFNTWLAQEDLTLEQMQERLRSDMIATQMANRIAEAVPARAEHVHARHILVDTEEEARRILSQLQAGGDFVSLAQTYSQDVSTRDVGGDLGFFPQGVLTSDEVEQAAFALQPGQLSDVVQSELGYHIVQVVDRNPDQEISPENLRLLKDQAVRSWLDELRASADIQVFVTP